MISPKNFFAILERNRVGLVTGIPDSLLRPFCSFVETLEDDRHLVGVNEGACVALAAGSYLASGQIPLIYMQNSGIGNAINPLLSLAHPEVYGIPMILLIGHRGKPGQNDEPQHIPQGRILMNLLKEIEVPAFEIGVNGRDFEVEIDNAFKLSASESRPIALVVGKDFFSEIEIPKVLSNSPLNSLGVIPNLFRSDAVKEVIDCSLDGDIFFSSTGFVSRQIYGERLARGQDPSIDFMVVGSMGHTSQLALGFCLNRRKRAGGRIICVEGDGSLLMHMGSLAVVGTRNGVSLVHVLINNGMHESVGGARTVGFDVDFGLIAKGCGFDVVFPRCLSLIQVRSAFAAANALEESKTVFIEICVKPQPSTTLPRPNEKPRQSGIAFKNHWK